jgi:hypothetical protein
MHGVNWKFFGKVAGFRLMHIKAMVQLRNPSIDPCLYKGGLRNQPEWA